MRVSVLVTVAAILVLGAACFAEEVIVPPYITVYGIAEDWVSPDEALWTIEIAHSGKDVGGLRDSNRKERDRVLSVAEQLGVLQENVAVGRIYLSKEYKTDEDGRNKRFSHYTLRRVVEIRQTELDRADAFLEALLVDEGLVARLQYRATSIDSVRAQLKLQAVENARTKAVAMAEVLGVEVGEPMIISEYPIVTDHVSVDRLAKQSGRVWRPVPTKVHATEKAFVRFRLEEKLLGP